MARCAGPVALAVALAIAACDERSGDPPPAAPPAVDLSGTWAGTWAGVAPEGSVTGTWEASVRQTASAVTGTVVLGGDVDCPDATVIGGAAEGNVLTGTLERAPCDPHSWTVTGLDLVGRTMSGLWTQARGASGTFTGRQVARPGGPHVAFLSPPAGPPGTVVTIVGRGFFPDAARTWIEFDGVPAAVAAVSLDALVAIVPTTATSGRLAVTTPYGTAMSPSPFGTTPSSPRPAKNAVLQVESSPDGLVIGPEGRRVYVANRGSGTVSMLDLRGNALLATTPVDFWSSAPVQGVAASPDGRRIYVATGALGVTVLDTALDVVVDAFPLLAGEGLQGNPHGIAVSPDGRTLYVADDRDGGAVSVVDLATQVTVASLSRGPGSRPTAVAASPDGARAWFAFGGADVLDEYVVESGTTVRSVAVGARPLGIAVSPDGARLFLTAALDGAVLAVDAETLAAGAAVPVGAGPRGIAISPDGSRLYVANHGSGSVSVVGTDPFAVETTIASFCGGPSGVAMSADGRRALVSCEEDGTVVEVGGPYTLTVGRSGSGYGQVTSVPEGIACGPACVARFDPGTVVTLVAEPDPSNVLASWSCTGGAIVSSGDRATVEMTGSRHCTATFTYVTGGGPGGDPVGHCFVATAAYGTDLAGEVRALRALRDRVLLPTAPGRALVRAYYALSPPLAGVIARHEALRAGARAVLAPLAWAADRPDRALLGAVAVALAALLPLGRRGRRREAP